LNVLVIGSGGREHCLVWKLSQSKSIDKIYCAPGNAGISSDAECLDIEVEDFEGLLQAARDKKVDLTIVGPELPLSLGVVNLFEKNNIPVFGPTKEAAEIESSKVFAKNLMDKFQVPTARYQVFEDYKQAHTYLQQQYFPLVIKADGLAAGKGVLIVQDLSQAEKAISSIMRENKFGSAGRRVVVEEYLTGEEVSMLVFTDGEYFIPMKASQDHKKIGDGDFGLNTGGMGAYSPVPFFDFKAQNWVLERVFKPVIKGMREEGRKFKGVLYAGLVLTEEGPKVLEFNARFGDPETQVILPGLKTDLIEILNAVQEEKLNKIKVEWSNQAAVCIVLASGGYPAAYEKGKIITGLEKIDNQQNAMVFHAGTKKKNSKFITSGGRVLGVTAWDDTLTGAIEKAYETAEKINFEKVYYRKDIGKKGLKLFPNNIK
jgi:phosphoribosylamine---glycine ligase